MQTPLHAELERSRVSSRQPRFESAANSRCSDLGLAPSRASNRSNRGFTMQTLRSPLPSFVTLLCFCVLAVATPAMAGPIFHFSGAGGLSAEVEFDLLNPTTLKVRTRNTSSGVPGGFSNSDQLLTSVSWDFGAAGAVGGDPAITGGSVVIGPTSASLNFDNVGGVQLGPGAVVSGEYGFGNGGTTGLLPNYVSGNVAGTTAFGGTNRDGPANINGPQAGLVSDALPVALGGLGAIQDEWIATLTLSTSLANLDFLSAHGVVVEFGSDAAFLVVPEPSSLVLAVSACGTLLLCVRRRQRNERIVANAEKRRV
ncbi:MAG: hypothetical protein K1X74_11825 [Pirellulales bacterium]|nr:hypothetical protein [Pirellulales bacterium]